MLIAAAARRLARAARPLALSGATAALRPAAVGVAGRPCVPSSASAAASAPRGFSSIAALRGGSAAAPSTLSAQMAMLGLAPSPLALRSILAAAAPPQQQQQRGISTKRRRTRKMNKHKWRKRRKKLRMKTKK